MQQVVVVVAVWKTKTGRPLLLVGERRYHFREKNFKVAITRWADKNPKEVAVRMGGAWPPVGCAAVGVSVVPAAALAIGTWTRLFSLVTLCPGEKQHTVFLLNLCVNWPVLCIIISE